MTEVNPPLFEQTGCYSAAAFRSWMTIIAGGKPGVYGASDMLVTLSTGRTVAIAAGNAFVLGTLAANQGMYLCTNDTTAKTLTHAAGDATNPRLDLIVARIYDSMFGTVTGGDRWALEIVAGTPAAVPALPTLPASSLALASVRVGAGATTVAGGDITDLRTFARTSVSQYVRTTDPDNAVGVDNDIWIKVI